MINKSPFTNDKTNMPITGEGSEDMTYCDKCGCSNVDTISGMPRIFVEHQDSVVCEKCFDEDFNFSKVELQAEITRLKEALKSVLEWTDIVPGDCDHSLFEIERIVKEALKEN